MSAVGTVGVEVGDNSFTLVAVLWPDHMEVTERWRDHPTHAEMVAWQKWKERVLADVLRRLQLADSACFN